MDGAGRMEGTELQLDARGNSGRFIFPYASSYCSISHCNQPHGNGVRILSRLPPSSSSLLWLAVDGFWLFFSMAVRITDLMEGKTDGSIRGNIRVLHFPAKSNPQSSGCNTQDTRPRDATIITLPLRVLYSRTMANKEAPKKQSSRASFDDDGEHDVPQNSLHWQSLHHKVETDELLRNMEDLTTCFKASLLSASTSNDKEETLAIWSCVAGYCEALATHKMQRYSIFPIPIDALRRLVTTEFMSFLSNLMIVPSSTSSNHRDMVRTVANAIWAKAIPKPNIRDEIHANSLYVCLRGQIDKKSLDCFGASVVTIAALRMLGVKISQLCLSEDHAYERHKTASNGIGTCEVAIPGNNKLSKSKRAREIAATFEKTKEAAPYLTPQTSWLYMASNPIICDTVKMALVAVVGNINCTIEKKKKGYYLGSGQLYDVKRELLWILYDHGHMKRFPFGLLELGDCEEHRGSPRSSEWITVADLDEPILVNEKLFRDAIQINRDHYNEAQVYPYYCTNASKQSAGRLYCMPLTDLYSPFHSNRCRALSQGRGKDVTGSRIQICGSTQDVCPSCSSH